MKNIGPWRGQEIVPDIHWVQDALSAKILELDWDETRKEMIRFVKPQDLDVLRTWNREFFLTCVEKLT